MTTALPAPAHCPAATPGQPVFDWASFDPFPSHFLGVSTFDAADSNQVRRYLDWDALFRKWEFPVRFPDVLDNTDWGDMARNLLHDANVLLNDWLAEGKLQADVVFGVWRASAEGDQIVVQTGDQPSVRLLFPRLPAPGGLTYCAADFIKPAAALKAGESDYIGGYAIRLDAVVLEPIRQLAAMHDEYRTVLATDLCTLYRSAVADYVHYQLRRFIWAYCDDDDLSNEDLLVGLHQGIRVELGGRECSDRAEQTKLLDLLGVDGWAVGSSPDGADDSTSVVGGYFFAHPRSRNFPSEFIPNASNRSL